MDKWEIINNVFNDGTQNNKIAIVIEDILDEVERLVPEGPPQGIKPIKLINDRVSGPTFYWPKASNHYKIALNVSGVHYNQVAFQFAQELCRIYSDPMKNTWLIQLMGHIMALYFLDFLSKSWKAKPPLPELKDYWLQFESYKSNLLNAAFAKIDIEKYQVNNEWAQYQIKKLKQKDLLNRGKVLIIANELLGLFTEHPDGWRALPFISKTYANKQETKHGESPNVPEGDYLAYLLGTAPAGLHAFIEKFYSRIGLIG